MNTKKNNNKSNVFVQKEDGINKTKKFKKKKNYEQCIEDIERVNDAVMFIYGTNHEIIGTN